jgi:hypothetical protein
MDYGPLCKGTWEDHGYDGPIAAHGETTHPGYPEIRNMAPVQVAHITATWDAACNRGWGPDVRM